MGAAEKTCAGMNIACFVCFFSFFFFLSCVCVCVCVLFVCLFVFCFVLGGINREVHI